MHHPEPRLNQAWTSKRELVLPHQKIAPELADVLLCHYLSLFILFLLGRNSSCRDSLTRPSLPIKNRVQKFRSLEDPQASRGGIKIFFCSNKASGKYCGDLQQHKTKKMWKQPLDSSVWIMPRRDWIYPHLPRKTLYLCPVSSTAYPATSRIASRLFGHVGSRLGWVVILFVNLLMSIATVFSSSDHI